MVITCPNCSAFQLEIEELDYPRARMRTHCRSCNHDVQIVINPGEPIMVTAVHRPSPKRRVRSLEDRVPVEQR